ncbi:hypothetical protein G6514_000810 [Epicoccum nigrum]|nr:hypothetical protein G6514_000810 [Epicoccum nigrum]
MDSSASAPSVPRPPEIPLVVSPAQDKEREIERLREREDVIQYAGFCFGIIHECPVNRPKATGDIVLDIVMFCRRKPTLHFMHTPSLPPKVRRTRDIISIVYGVSELMMGRDYPVRTHRAPNANDLITGIEIFHDRLISYLIGEAGDSISWHQPFVQDMQKHHRTRMDSTKKFTGYLCFNQTLLQDKDMLDILNARRTVLLNSLFLGSPEVLDVVALAILAMDLFHGKVPKASKLGAWFIPLIKDDILTLLLSATDKSRLRQLQCHYISILKSEAIRWRLDTTRVEMTRYLTMADAQCNCFRPCLEKGQEACCTYLSLCRFEAGKLVGRLRKDTPGELRQHTEYPGGALQELYQHSLDTVVGELLCPWLARRKNGRWFFNPLESTP